MSNSDHQQDEDESEDNDDNDSIDEEQEEEEEEMEDEEEAEEEPLVVEEKRLLAENIHGEQHLAQFCRDTTLELEETERIFKCKHPNCPFRVSYVSKEAKLYAINQHKHNN